MLMCRGIAGANGEIAFVKCKRLLYIDCPKGLVLNGTDLKCSVMCCDNFLHKTEKLKPNVVEYALK